MKWETIHLVRASVPYAETPVDDSPWDADAAIDRLAKWAGIDAEGAGTEAWDRFAGGFAWYDKAAAQTRAAYKLPHHDVVEGKLVLNRVGLGAAAGALEGARGGADIPADEMPAVRMHLQRHYHAIGERAPWEPKEEPMGRAAPILCAVEALRTIYSLVAEPDAPDFYDNVMDWAVIAKAAHDFTAERGRLVVGHRVHPHEWPAGVDAEIGMSPTGGVAVRRVYFNRREGWTVETARAWLVLNSMDGVPAVLDDGPIEPELVESFLAPTDLYEMHGIALARRVPAKSWIVAGRFTEEEWAKRDEYTGTSLGGSVRYE